MSFTILGTGSALPAQQVTNDQLSQIMDTSHAWIHSRTGIDSRPICRQETVTQLALEAARQALENAGVVPGELDYILCPTLVGDTITPSLACLVQEGLGAGCPAVDLNAACSGFLYAMDLARGLFAAGQVRRVLIVAAEKMSRLVDWRDRSTCVLFGDGAGAAVLGPGEDLLSLLVTAQGTSSPLRIAAPSGNCPYSQGEGEESYLAMNGQEVYRFAVGAIARDIPRALELAGVTPGQVDHLLLHQANLRILEAAQKKLGIPLEKYAVNIATHGNLSAVSVPLLLDEMNRSGRLRPGEILALCAFGGGLTTGAAVLRWRGTPTDK